MSKKLFYNWHLKVLQMARMTKVRILLHRITETFFLDRDRDRDRGNNSNMQSMVSTVGQMLTTKASRRRGQWTSELWNVDEWTTLLWMT